MITYQLKTPKAKKDTLIFLIYYFNKAKLKMSTGETIHPDHWNPLTRRSRKTATNHSALNKFLDKLETKVKEIHLDMRAEFEEISPASLKLAVQRALLYKGNRETMMEFIARFIKESRETRPPGSLSVYTSVEKQLKKYPGPKNFADIGPEWFKKFQVFMEKEGYAANYIGKTITIIRELMTIAKKAGLTKNTMYKDSDYKKPREVVDSIYLKPHELLRMYQIPLTPAMDAYRNRFLIGAFTALRFSDSAKITFESIRDGLIFDRSIKTKTDVVIPIHWVIKQIMEDNPDGLPCARSNQKTNDALKVIARDAGITTPIVQNKTIGGKQIMTTTPKCDLVSTHCGRRSAATNMFMAGIPAIKIMKITGHRTEAAFMKYIRMSAEESATSLMDHSYFNKD